MADTDVLQQTLISEASALGTKAPKESRKFEANKRSNHSQIVLPESSFTIPWLFPRSSAYIIACVVIFVSYSE